jgi:hypothetical protein
MHDISRRYTLKPKYGHNENESRYRIACSLIFTEQFNQQ